MFSKMTAFLRKLCYLLFLHTMPNLLLGNPVVPHCSVDQETCEFTLSLGVHKMMGYYKQYAREMVLQGMASFHSDGNVTVQPELKCDHSRVISQEEASTIQSGDGSHKMAFLFNGSLPGPPIVVYRGQEVVVRVTNNLVGEGTTVHWHGVTQFNTPCMDGVEGVSQCIINPGETFTYRFHVEQAGTFWYHTHSSVQRTMGARGPFIVLDSSQEEENNKRVDDPLPEMETEFYMMVSDWFHQSSREIQEIVHNEAISYFGGWDALMDQCYSSTKAPDGLDAGVVPFHSGIINGKGFHYTSSDNSPENEMLPLEQFVVQRGKRYRFRMIGSAMAFVFCVSIDNHKLHVISTDGHDVITRSVDYILIASGERYDFWIEANDPEELGLYWIRAETYEMYNYLNQKISQSHTEAILRYDSAATILPVSVPKSCTIETPCEVLNCPFKHFGPPNTAANLTCLPITELRSTVNNEDVNSPKDNEHLETSEAKMVDEHFLNFHMALDNMLDSDAGESWIATVNGNINMLYAVPPQIDPNNEELQRIPCECPANEVCPCSHIIEVPLGTLVQFVLIITVTNPPGFLNGLPHNIHLHGHSFRVLKIGYPFYDSETGFYTERNPDIECLSEQCNKAGWTNQSWSGGNVPDTVQSPPLKDTVLVPIGGYAVVQFEANNPGYWYMHCHTEFHNEEGMSLVVKVGDNSEMAPLPSHMTQCADSDWMAEVVSPHSSRDLPQTQITDSAKPSCQEKRLFHRNVTFGLAALCVLFIILNTILLCKSHRRKIYISI